MQGAVVMANSVGDRLDHAPCGFVSFGDDSRITYLNTTLAERLGYRVDDLVGRHVESILTVPGRIFHQTHFFPLVKLHGRAQEVFMLLRTSAGDDVGTLCNAVRHERSGTPVTDCVFMEVQERRKFEDALLQARQAADRANVALASRTEEAEEAAARLETQALELEMQHQQLQEQSVILAAQSEQLRLANETLRSLNDDLQVQRAAADDANKAKSNFLAVMSHELRTPLNAISGYVQLLDMGVHGPVSQAQRETLARIDRSQRHLLRLINDVLNLARIEAGRVDYVIQTVDLDEVLGSTLQMVEPQMSSRKLRMESRVPAGLSARADRDKLQQIVLNLLTNATKFTAPGGSIRVEAAQRGTSEVVLSVIDSGIGIPEHMVDKVFEPFIQVDASHSRAGEGTGLGLAISRDLARGMGGDLSAESQVGVGSSFHLVLQRAE